MTDAVVIESIDIQRAPGIVEAFALPEFGPGVNIVTGPNASGKSTTARLLHQLFWKHDGRSDAHLIVRFRLGSDRWTLRRDGRSLACTCNGEVRSLPPFDQLGDETRDRYLLALHDLLSAGDAAFARTIAREMAGGFDLDAAAKSLGYQAKPSAPQSLKQELDRANTGLRQATNQQEALFSREEDLERLRSEAAQAKAAQTEIVRIEQIGRTLVALQELDAARQALKAYPDALGRFRGDERDVVDSLTSKGDHLRQQRQQAEENANRASARMAELQLPPLDELEMTLVAMSAHLKSIEAAEQAASAERINREAAVDRRRSTLRGIAGVIDPDRMDEQTIDLFDELAAALEKLDRAESTQAAMRAVEAWIGSAESPADLDRISAGIRDLQRWLRAPDPAEQAAGTASFFSMGFVAAFVLVIEAIVLGLRVHPALFALLVVPIALLGWLYQKRAPAHDARVGLEQHFVRLDVGEPAAWQPGDVEDLLEHLLAQASAGMVEREKAQRWADLARQRSEADQMQQAALAEVRLLEQHLGLERALNAESAKVVRQALFDAIDANRRAQESVSRLVAIENERQRALDAFNALSAPLSVTPVSDGAGAIAQLQQLQSQAAEAAEAVRALDQARSVIANQLDPALTEIDAQRRALLERVGIETADDVVALAADWEPWRTAKKRCDDAELTLRERQSQLPEDFRIDAWTAERVEQERHEQAYRASQYEPLMGQISTIEAELRQAKQGRSVEQALADVSNARTRLQERRAEDIARALGALVVETVRRQTDEANLPDVARRARELFSRITRGRYELRIAPGEPPTFQALDTISGIIHPLEELSSGTRVQLLLSVRAAFVEANERGAKLPLLLDETLANADESRAESMIEAAFDLAEEGRQLFYFTAQRDEVEKWRSIGAGRTGTPLTVVDLAAARHIPSQIRSDWLELPRMERVLPPEPDGMSRAEYRDLIGVEPLNLWSNGDGDIHLWYLAPDLTQLFGLLAGDVSTWGQLKSYIDQGAAGQFGFDGDAVARISARAKLCGAIRAEARIGRGLPVTAATLDASGAISPRYVEESRALLDECNGDARTFLERLHNRGICGFRGDKITQLEHYFRDNGHLVDDARLDPAELAHRVRIELTAEMVDGLLTQDDLRQMMNDLAIAGTEINRRAAPDQTAAAPALPVP